MPSGDKRMMDLRRGRVLGVSVVDILVLLILAFGVASYVLKPSGENAFRGNQMYTAIQTHQRLDSRGFLVEGEVKGTYLWDNTPFDERGLILPSTGGRLRLRKRSGEVFVIGGERAYVEDVAASLIRMWPVDSYLITFYLEPQSFETYEELIAYLSSVKSEMRAEHLYLDVEIAFNAPLSPAERESVVNSLSSMYLVKSTYLSRAEPTGFVVNFVKAEVGEMAELPVGDARVSTSRIRAFAGYAAEPEVELPQGSHLVSARELL